MSETVKVHLLGRDYMLRSAGDPNILQEAALLVEEKFAEVSTTISVDTRDRQLLAMLNLAGEFLQEKYKRLRVEEEQRKLEADLVQRIEDTLRK